MRIRVNSNPAYQDVGPRFSECKISVLQHVNTICLQIDSERERIWLRGGRDELRKVLQSLLSELDPVSQTILEKRARAMTPHEVIQYFYQSPVLASMAEDVDKVLSQLVAPVAPMSDLEIVQSQLDINDLFYNGSPIRGAQSRIADALGVPNAGSYRSRIVKVLSTLAKRNSTTATRPVEGGRNAA